MLMGKAGTKTRPVKLDASTHSMQVIDYPHHEIHGGSSYLTSDVQAVATSTIKYMVTTPNTTKYGHMRVAVEGTGEILVTITEGADRTGTTALAEINQNRNSSNTAGIAIHRGATGGTTDGATTIFTHRSGTTSAGGTMNQSGTIGEQEFILKQNTKYVIVVETFASINVSMLFDWYEHTDKD